MKISRAYKTLLATLLTAATFSAAAANKAAQEEWVDLFNGKDFSSSKISKETEVLEQNCSTLFSLRPQKRLYEGFRHVPNMLQGTSQRRHDPRHKKIVLVDRSQSYIN